jgi:hypothetical protein
MNTKTWNTVVIVRGVNRISTFETKDMNDVLSFFAACALREHSSKKTVLRASQISSDRLCEAAEKVGFVPG